jgi:phospholipid N-methyltransferase
MSLFPAEDILTKEIESWKSFADSLSSQEYREIFNKMLSECYKYVNAINTKESLFLLTHYLCPCCSHNKK